MSQQARLKATVYGAVQGVNFRAFVRRQALALGLTGYAQNLPSGEVEVVAEGDRKKLEQLLKHLEVGPREARVTRVEPHWSEHKGAYTGFERL